MANKSEYVGIRITSEQRERWEQFAAEDHRSLADWIRVQIEKTCDKLESEKKSK